MTAPTFREAAESAMGDDVNNSEEPVAQAAEAVQETKPEAAQEAQPQEEVVAPFAEKPELSGKSPEELNQIYNDWQAKYTQQRQRERAEIREMQARIAEFERLQSQPAQVPQAPAPLQQPDIQQQKQEVQRQYDLGNMSVDQYTEYMRGLMAEEARQIAREEFQSLTAQQQAEYEQRQEQETQQSFVQDFFAVDPRLNPDSPTFSNSMFNAIKTSMAEMLDDHIQNYGSSRGFDAKGIAQQFVAEYDKEIDSIIKTRVQSNTQSAREKVQRISRTSPIGTASQGVSTGSRSFREIASEAFDSMG